MWGYWGTLSPPEHLGSWCGVMPGVEQALGYRLGVMGGIQVTSHIVSTAVKAAKYTFVANLGIPSSAFTQREELVSEKVSFLLAISGQNYTLVHLGSFPCASENAAANEAMLAEPAAPARCL